MRTIIALTLCGLFFAIPTVDSQAVAAAPATAPSKKATALARCRFELREPKLEADVFDLVISAQQPVADMLGVTPDRAELFISVEPMGESRYVLAVVLPSPEVPEDKMLAEQALRKVLTIVEDGLAERQLEIEGMSGTAHNADRFKQRIKAAQDKMDQIDAAIREKWGDDELAIKIMNEGVPSVYNEREGLKLQQIGKQARQKALAEAIDRLATAAEKRATSDPVTIELTKVIEARVKELSQLMKLQETGAASPADVTRAESAVAEARAKMFERQEAVKQFNGGTLLSTLNHELATLTIESAESEAKLAFIDGALKKRSSIEPLMKQRREVDLELAKARQDLDALEPRLKRVQMILEGPPVRMMRFETMKPGDPRVETTFKAMMQQRGGGGLFGHSPEGH